MNKEELLTELRCLADKAYQSNELQITAALHGMIAVLLLASPREYLEYLNHHAAFIVEKVKDLHSATKESTAHLEIMRDILAAITQNKLSSN
ncbi:MAG: hypothetical protein H9535_14300 [Ignavibacteria bacterium]|nr:hypothetical protein [Ignavibacteria bacterium]